MQNFHILDVIVVIVFFAITLGLGLYFSKKNVDTDEYFLGGRSLPGWALGMSLLGTVMSSVSFIALPADGFKTTFVRLSMGLVFPFVCLFAAYILLPFFRRGTITSAYEYLSHRFGHSVSCYAASIFFLFQIIRISSVLYLVALLIQSITGLDFVLCMLLAGGITAIYTVGGGLDAVIWTDVLQTITLIIGAFIMVGVILYNSQEGFSQLLSTAWEHKKFLFTADLNNTTGQIEALPKGFSLSNKTFLMLLIAGVVQFLVGQFDQTSIQRWCSAKSAKEARKAILFLGFASLPVWLIFTFVGTMLWAYFHFTPNPDVSEMLSGVRKAEEIVPYFVTRYVPTGCAGLVIAGALAAAMSTLSSSINSASMVWVRDIYKPYIAKEKTDKHYLKVGFAASAVVSILMLIGAYMFYISTSKTISDLGIILTSVCGGGMLAVFLLGLFTRRGDSKAVWTGLLCNGLFTTWLLLGSREMIPAKYTWSIDLYYNALLGNILTFCVILLSSRIFKAQKRNLTNLTIWDQDGEPLV
jgi:solute:Na+ symporter, SSS family